MADIKSIRKDDNIVKVLLAQSRGERLDSEVLANTDNQNNGCVDIPHLLFVMQDFPLVAIGIFKITDVDLFLEICISQWFPRKRKGIYHIQTVLFRILPLEDQPLPCPRIINPRKVRVCQFRIVRTIIKGCK